MKKTIILFSIAVASVIGLTNCSSSSSDNSGASYEENKMSLEDQEKGNPLKFLTVDGTFRKNLLGEWVIEGSITNSATVAVYKDVELRIGYESKTGSDMGAESKIIYEVFAPGSTKPIKIKTMGPEGSEKISLDVVSALPKE